MLLASHITDLPLPGQKKNNNNNNKQTNKQTKKPTRTAENQQTSSAGDRPAMKQTNKYNFPLSYASFLRKYFKLKSRERYRRRRENELVFKAAAAEEREREREEGWGRGGRKYICVGVLLACKCSLSIRVLQGWSAYMFAPLLKDLQRVSLVAERASNVRNVFRGRISVYSVPVLHSSILH